mmetsp:Transcript_25303/g.60818  ORF Transcript_25303/g.60818 Transcript_25303/m.60818 type:complete len:662 (+) Transcript_25303:156-2141(+)
MRDMASLLDSEDGSSSSEESHESVSGTMSNGLDDDDVTTFTVATVLETRERDRSDKSRRDTITRTMPTISINDYTIPTTVEKVQLRATDSLVDDSSDSENDGHGFRRRSRARLSEITTKNSYGEDMFSTPTQHGHNMDNLSYTGKSTALRRNIAAADASKQCKAGNDCLHQDKPTNLLDIEVDSEYGQANRCQSSDTFMSVYEDLGTKRRTPAKTKYDSSYATTRRTRVKTIVTATLKSMANGLASQGCDGVGSWDVEDLQSMSGKKRSIDIGESTENGRQKNRRKSSSLVDDKAELTRMHRLVHKKIEECATLKHKLEESQSQVQLIRNENSIIVQSKAVLESKLEISKQEASAANARMESHSCQLRDSQSEIEGLRLDLEVEREKSNRAAHAVNRAESELKQMKQEIESSEREHGSLKSRAELQDEHDKMRHALKEMKELDCARSRKTHHMEAELHGARHILSKAKSAAADAESILASLRGDMEGLKKENSSLRAQLKQSEMQPGPNPILSWEEGAEGIEVQMNDATLKTANLDQVNALGADRGSSSSDHDPKLPLKAALQRTPDSASRQVKFAPVKSVFSAGKENHRYMNRQQTECSLCFHPPRPNGIIKSCQCGKVNCNKWAHATCLLNRKSVSSSVSHPGTPAPTILCDGFSCKEI